MIALDFAYATRGQCFSPNNHITAVQELQDIIAQRGKGLELKNLPQAAQVVINGSYVRPALTINCGFLLSLHV